MPPSFSASIEFPHAVVNGVSVCSIAPGQYRIDDFLIAALLVDSEQDIASLPRFGDTFEATPTGNHQLSFLNVLERGSWIHFDWLLTQAQCESDPLKQIMKEVVTAGGEWERQFGGFLVVALPPECDYDIESRLAEALLPLVQDAL